MKRTNPIFYILTLSLLCLTTLPANAQGRLAYRGFSGGMMVHSGYVCAGDIAIQTPSGPTPKQSIKGLPMGIGGAIKFHFGEHLRLGTEGYSSSLGYGDYGSSVGLGWGGLLVDVYDKWGRWEPFVGATFGGGVVDNLTLNNPIEDDFMAEEGTSFRRYGTALVVPFAGVEYSLSERMGLVFKADYALPLGPSRPDFPSGVRLYVGFMFKHF